MPSDPLPSLDSLQKKIDDAKALKRSGNPDIESNSGGLAQAMQVATRFVAGAATGAAFGYFIDRWLGTSPVFFIIGFFLGFAAGIYQLMRDARKE